VGHEQRRRSITSKPRQTTHRVPCPTCGAWAQLRIADPIGGLQTEPVVVMFSCVNQTSAAHPVPDDSQLLLLLPDSGASAVSAAP
jgi:hypothetical protein